MMSKAARHVISLSCSNKSFVRGRAYRQRAQNGSAAPLHTNTHRALVLVLCVRVIGHCLMNQAQWCLWPLGGGVGPSLRPIRYWLHVLLSGMYLEYCLQIITLPLSSTRM